MTYHSTVFSNKELRRLLESKGYDLTKVQLTQMIGKPARTKGKVVERAGLIIVFGSDFIAKLRQYKHRVIK